MRTFCMVINYIADGLCMSDPVGHAESVLMALFLYTLAGYLREMTDAEDFKKIKDDISNIMAMSRTGMKDYHAFIYWFINNLYGYSEERISQAICDGAHDKGIDACLIDDLEKTITLIQSKYEREGDSRIQNESEVILFSSIDKFFSSPDSFESAIANANSRSKELLRKAFHKYFSEKYAVESIFITTHKRNNRIDEMLDTTLRQRYIMKLRVFYYDNIIAFYRDSERNFLPLAHPFDLEYKAEGELFKSSHTKAWVFTINAEEIKRFAMSYDGNELFRKNVRNFLGPSETNKRMYDTLKDKRESENFWFYNNGITVLCRDARNDHDNRHIKLEDPQVINGCQTVTSIKNFMGDTKADVLVRVIASNDNEFMENVVHYQNSSNPVKKRDLKSNDSVQIRLHRELLKRGWFYEIKSGEDFKSACILNPSLKKLCNLGPIDNRDLAKAIVATQFNPALAAGQGENYYFGEMYEDIFTNDLSSTSALAMIELEWLVQYDIGWSNKKFHEEFDKEWTFKKPAHYVLNGVFYKALMKVDDGLRRFTNFYDVVWNDSEEWTNFRSALGEIADDIYEIEYKAYSEYNKRTGNWHNILFKNQEEVTKMLKDYEKEFATQQELAGELFKKTLT